MKTKTVLNYEKKTGGNFFALTQKIADGSYTMTDVLHMVWVIRMDKDPKAKLEDIMESDLELNEVLKEINELTTDV